MRYQRIRTAFVIAILAIVVVVVGMLVSRKSQPITPGAIGSSQPTHNPTAKTSGNVDTRVKHLDAKSSPPKSVFVQSTNSLDTHLLVECHRLLQQQQKVEPINCDAIGLDSTQHHNLCLQQQVMVGRQIQSIIAASASCPEDVVGAEKYYAELRQRALGGDVDAQRCFTMGHFANPLPNFYITDDQSKEYPTLARQFIDAAFERGDWRVVRWLGKTKLSTEDGLIRSIYPIGLDHPETNYRMELLLLKGLGPEALDQELVPVGDILKIYKSGQQKLSEAQLKESEDWARDMYQAHFVGVPDTVKNPSDVDCM